MCIDLDQIPPVKADKKDVFGYERIGGADIRVASITGRRNTQEDTVFVADGGKRDSTHIQGFLDRAFAQTAKAIATRSSEKNLAGLKQRIPQLQQQVKEAPAQSDAAQALQRTLGKKKWKQYFLQEGGLQYSQGSTATVAYISPDNKITVAHVGDSPAYLFVRDHATGEVKAHELAPPHLPTDEIERQRIEDAGGTVTEKGLIDNDLPMSRAFGDLRSPGVSSIPSIRQIDLARYTHSPLDRTFLCVASDGLLITRKNGKIRTGPKHYAEIVKRACLEHREPQLAELFAEYAHQRGSRDNISVLVTELAPTRSSDIVMGVCDGHGGQYVAKAAARLLEQQLIDPKLARSSCEPAR